MEYCSRVISLTPEVTRRTMHVLVVHVGLSSYGSNCTGGISVSHEFAPLLRSCSNMHKCLKVPYLASAALVAAVW